MAQRQQMRLGGILFGNWRVKDWGDRQKEHSLKNALLVIPQVLAKNLYNGVKYLTPKLRHVLRPILESQIAL